MLANITGVDNHVAILNEETIDLLRLQCRKAKAELQKAESGASAALELCTTLDGVLRAFAHVRNEYYDRIEIERERSEAEHKLQEATDALQKP